MNGLEIKKNKPTTKQVLKSPKPQTYLVHSCVGEEKSGVIMGDGGRRGDEGVSELVTEIRDEGLADPDGGPMFRLECHFL